MNPETPSGPRASAVRAADPVTAAPVGSIVTTS